MAGDPLFTEEQMNKFLQMVLAASPETNLRSLKKTSFIGLAANQLNGGPSSKEQRLKLYNFCRGKRLGNWTPNKGGGRVDELNAEEETELDAEEETELDAEEETELDAEEGTELQQESNGNELDDPDWIPSEINLSSISVEDGNGQRLLRSAAIGKDKPSDIHTKLRQEIVKRGLAEKKVAKMTRDNKKLELALAAKIQQVENLEEAKREYKLRSQTLNTQLTAKNKELVSFNLEYRVMSVALENLKSRINKVCAEKDQVVNQNKLLEDKTKALTAEKDQVVNQNKILKEKNKALTADVKIFSEAQESYKKFTAGMIYQITGL